MMPPIDVVDFDFTARAVAKMWGHGIDYNQLLATLRQEFVITRNRRSRTASHMLIGLDDQGQCIAAPIVATDDPLIWRPITAWYCKPGETAILRQRRRR